MTSEDIVKAIKRLKPTAQFSMTENDFSSVKWDFIEGNAPTMKELEDVLKVINAEELAAQAQVETKKQEVLAKLGLTAEEMAALLK